MNNSQRKILLINIPNEAARIIRDQNPDSNISVIAEAGFEYCQRTRIFNKYDLVVIGSDPRIYMPRSVRRRDGSMETMPWREALKTAIPHETSQENTTSSLSEIVLKCIISPLLSDKSEAGRQALILPPNLAPEDVYEHKIRTMAVLSDEQLRMFGSSIFQNIFSDRTAFDENSKPFGLDFPFLREKAQYYDPFIWHSVDRPVRPLLNLIPEGLHENIMDRAKIFPKAKHFTDNNNSIILCRSTNETEEVVDLIDGFIKHFSGKTQSYAGFDKIHEYYEREIKKPFPIIGSSEALKRFLHQLFLASFDKKGHVLLMGETGSGKELAAEVLHKMTFRKVENFVPVNCALLRDNLSESILFGSVKGGFTDAIDKLGLVSSAHRGTLFLDEIQSIHPSVMPQLLRFMQTGEYRRVGESRIRTAIVRIIAATNSDSFTGDKKLHESGFLPRFAHTLRIPSLRYRKDDIHDIANHYFNELARKESISTVAIPSPGVSELELWKSEDWCNSNVRGLQSAVSHYFFNRLAIVRTSVNSNATLKTGPKACRITNEDLIKLLKDGSIEDSKELFTRIQTINRPKTKDIYYTIGALKGRISRYMSGTDKEECEDILKNKYYKYPNGGEEKHNK